MTPKITLVCTAQEATGYKDSPQKCALYWTLKEPPLTGWY
jgi:hypothetical protein